MDLIFMSTAFATLFVVIDPIGLMPVFVALTSDRFTPLLSQQRLIFAPWSHLLLSL